MAIQYQLQQTNILFMQEFIFILFNEYTPTAKNRFLGAQGDLMIKFSTQIEISQSQLAFSLFNI